MYVLSMIHSRIRLMQHSQTQPAWAVFSNIQLYTTYPALLPGRTTYDPGMCGTVTNLPYLSWSEDGGTWVETTEANVLMPFGGSEIAPFEGSHRHVVLAVSPTHLLLIGSSFGVAPESFNYVQTLSSEAPNNSPAALTLKTAFHSFPSGARASILSDSNIMSKYPWIAGCQTLPGQGQPTVHVCQLVP